MSTDKTPREVLSSMSGQQQMPIDTWLVAGADGRRFRVEDYGPGRVWVQDIDHPTGMGWWVLREELNGRCVR